jgi:hypothetical protein
MNGGRFFYASGNEQRASEKEALFLRKKKVQTAAPVIKNYFS